MNENIRLGKIAGVPVGINWSIVVIFWLLTWELAVLVCPATAPPGDGGLLDRGVATTTLLFVSLLTREVSHAVARFVQFSMLRAQGRTTQRH